MSMRVGVLRERREGERRVAATVDSVKKLIGLGAVVVVESGAGLGSAVTDDAYRSAGAEVAADAAAALGAPGDAWYLLRSAGEDVREGYSVQDMALWAQDGTLIMLARQTVAIFG